jgi:hypothetical protein
VQIAIINYLAFLQNPRASRERGRCCFCLTHKRVYSLIGKEKGERQGDREQRAKKPLR